MEVLYYYQHNIARIMQITMDILERIQHQDTESQKNLRKKKVMKKRRKTGIERKSRSPGVIL